MGWGADIPRQRYHDLRAGLLDEWEIVVLYQDMIEKQCLPEALLAGAHHLIQMGICRVPGAMPLN